jgi:Zn ribbon nucleic-acid-binding protein
VHRGKYSILNKQYTKEEYEKLVPTIIEHMKQNNEWGEFPASQFSFFGYNETVAQEYFPLTWEQVLAKGWKWKDEDPKEYLPQNFQIPDSINAVLEDVAKEILTCEQCGKNYKIIPEELKFYKKMMLPVPRKCSTCRHMDRLKCRAPSKLWKSICAKCGIHMKSAYAPDRPEIVYCENCYLKAVY